MLGRVSEALQGFSGAGATGLEPATSGVTGRRSNRLSYAPVGGTVWQPPGAGSGAHRWLAKHASPVPQLAQMARVCRRRQPYSQEVGPVPKCKRSVPIHLAAVVTAAGAFATTAAAATVDGDAGPNRLKGTPEADVIQGFGGDDRVLAFGGDDRVLLSWGDDRTVLGPGDDDAKGGPGNDRIRGGAGNDSANGEGGRDRIAGRPGNDTLQGWAGKDLLWGGIGDDTLTGDVNDAGDRFSRDLLHGGAGADTLSGGDARDFILGGPDNDTSYGELGPDLMAGGPGDDTQDGGIGNDRIFANLGRDVTDGGEGNDNLWALLRADVTGPNDIAGDVVRGAAGNDRIHTRDGELDVVSCGAGFDVALLDFADAIEGATAAAPNGDCERVRRAVPRPGADAPEGEGG